MVLPFMSIYLGARFGMSVAEAGSVIALFGLGSMLGSIVGGKLSDRIGPVRLQIGTLLLTAVWMGFLSYAPTAPWFAAGVFVLGVFNDAFRPGNVAGVAASCAPYRQTKALTLNRLALNAGWASGPVLGGTLADIDFHLLYFVDGGTCALAGLLLWWLAPHNLGQHQPHPEGHPLASETPPSPWRDLRFLALLAVSTLCFATFLQNFQTLSRHLEGALGFSKSAIGAFLAINPIAIVLLEMPVVHALRHRSHLKVVAAGALCVGLAFPWLILQSLGGIAVVCTTVTITLGEMLYMPLLGAHVSATAPARARGSYLGAYFASFSIGFIVAPSVGGYVYDAFGPTALWLGCAVAGGLSALGFWALSHRRADAVVNAT
jgi:predicted MFS family arabinose efflux permease